MVRLKQRTFFSCLVQERKPMSLDWAETLTARSGDMHANQHETEAPL